MTMFNGERYVTREVLERVPVGVQKFLWNLIDNLIAQGKVEPDYLQIFELSAADGKGQRIVHRQEVPEYQVVYQFDKIAKPINIKLYVIDDEAYSTMLLPEER